MMLFSLFPTHPPNIEGLGEVGNFKAIAFFCRGNRSRIYQMGGGIVLYCEIFPPSWPWELSISGDCRLKGLQIFTGNSEHTVVFKI